MSINQIEKLKKLSTAQVIDCGFYLAYTNKDIVVSLLHKKACR